LKTNFWLNSILELSKQLQNILTLTIYNLSIYFLTVHSKINLGQSADSNDYNSPISKYTIVWDWIISVRCSLCLNNEIIIIEIKLILLVKKSEESKCHYNKHKIIYCQGQNILKLLWKFDAQIDFRILILKTIGYWEENKLSIVWIKEMVALISQFFCWLCLSYILNEIVKLLLNNTFIFMRFFYHGSVSKTFSYSLKSIFRYGGTIIIAVSTLNKICFGVHCQKINQ
jgi:hypothetical protein